MSTVVRRASDPLSVQQLWSAIRSIRSQKQVANEERIIKHVRRENGNEAGEAAGVQLQHAVSDGLIVAYRAVLQKGGYEQDAYRIPEADQVNGDHDWYCFTCHQPGAVLECLSCWRVYHPTCLSNISNVGDFTCRICQETAKPMFINPKELNRLLGFTINRLREKSTSLHWFGGAELGLDRFVHHYLDLNTMQLRTRQRYYSNLEQFHADVLNIEHNIHACFGDAGILQELARIMVRDCCYDLDEIRQCKDCYLHSNNKMKDWFCLPCRPPHDLVFAKQRGFSYWPAKVIKVNTEGYDVRFFGARHQRALVPVNGIKPIDTSTQALGVKRSSGFVRACAELARHRELLLHAAQHDGVNKWEEEDCIESDTETETKHSDNNNIKQHKVKRVRHKSEPMSDPEPPESDADSEPHGADSEPHGADSEPEYEPMSEPRAAVSVKRERIEPRRPNKNKKQKTNQKTLKNGTVNAHKHQRSVEDSTVVSSSEDRVAVTDAAVQTIKQAATASSDFVLTDAVTQTDVKVSSTCGADCEARFEVKLRDLRSRIERELQEQMQSSIKKLEERLRKEFEDDEQAAVSRAVSSGLRSVELARQQTDAKCREEFDAEKQRIAQSHASEISAVKKKQWCYNCESEAMYHCCWNTSYCSIKCQQDHWHREHKRVCRRKRN